MTAQAAAKRNDRLFIDTPLDYFVLVFALFDAGPIADRQQISPREIGASTAIHNINLKRTSA
jgi:hypothetical protein